MNIERLQFSEAFQKEGISLKKLKKYNGLFWLSFALIICFFIVMLVFMTDFYHFFYDGTQETGQFFKELQVLNKYAFNQSLVLVVGILCLLISDLKTFHGALGSSVISLGLTIFQIIKMVTVVPTMNYFISSYKKLELTANLYNANQLRILNVTNILEITIAIVLIVLTIQCFVLWIKNKKTLLRRVTNE